MAKVEVAGHGVVEVPDGSNWFIVARATKDLDVNTVLAVDTGTAVRDMSTTARWIHREVPDLRRSGRP